MSNSTYRAEVVPVVLEKHPGADLLSVAKVWGYSCVIRSADWAGITKAIYLPPDSTVNVARPEFSFLADQAKSDGRARIRAKKLRGVLSFGLLIPAPAEAQLGEDWAEKLDVRHYEQPVVGEKGKPGLFLGGEVATAPNLYSPKYDLEAFRRYHTAFLDDEEVYCFEKLDGTNSCFVYYDWQFHCKSRENWKKELPTYDHLSVALLMEKGLEEEEAKELMEIIHSKPKKRNIWWETLRKNEPLQKICQDNPGLMVLGECFGNVNVIKYGFPDGNRFAAFDLMKDGQWLDIGRALDLAKKHQLDWVPLVYQGPYSFDKVCELAEGPTLCEGAKSGTIREGVVISPAHERETQRLGRVKLKCVSAAFLERYK